MPHETMHDAMLADGLQPAAEIIPDGVFRRIDDRQGKPGNKLIGYICYGNAGYYCHWSQLPEGRKWHTKVEATFTEAERREYARQMQQAREERQRAEEDRRRECRQRSAWVWSQAVESAHPYLTAKGIKAHGAKVYQGRLVIPVYDATDTIVGLQYIAHDGTKRFEPGTPVTGNFTYILGDSSLPFYLCEGYATAATIHEATGATVFISFNCGNLKPVAEVMRKHMGAAKTIIICADNDHATPGNPGLTHATAAASAIGGLLAVPTFTEQEVEHG